MIVVFRIIRSQMGASYVAPYGEVEITDNNGWTLCKMPVSTTQKSADLRLKKFKLKRTCPWVKDEYYEAFRAKVKFI